MTLKVTQMVKNLPALQEPQVQALTLEDPLEKAVTTHSSILAWRIPWIEVTVHGVTKNRTRLSDYHSHSAKLRMQCIFRRERERERKEDKQKRNTENQ